MNIKTVLPFTLDELSAEGILPHQIYDVSHIRKIIGDEALFILQNMSEKNADMIPFQTGAVILEKNGGILTIDGEKCGYTIILPGSWQKSSFQVAKDKLNNGQLYETLPSVPQHFYIWELGNRWLHALQIGYVLGVGNFEYKQGGKRSKKPQLKWENDEDLEKKNYITGVDRLILEEIIAWQKNGKFEL
jgi:hypothetical protein